jgi:dienelactone hydrolase
MMAVSRRVIEMDIPWKVFVVVLAACSAGVQADDSKCAVLLLYAPGAGADTVAPLARKLQPVCATRTAASGSDIARHVRDLRQQGARRLVVAGHGAGANAAVAYAAAAGDIQGVVALGGDTGPGDLPGLAAKVKPHIPLLWVVGSRDPIAKLGEDYAYNKASPHPSSRFVEVKADAAGTPEAAVKAVTEWVKALD